MRRTKPPVGWEHVKNCFPVPNELLEFDLPGGDIAVYLYLLRHADRRTSQCHPSTATIAKKLHYCRNTVANHVRLWNTTSSPIRGRRSLPRSHRQICGSSTIP